WFQRGLQARLVDQAQVPKPGCALAAVEHSQEVEHAVAILSEPIPKVLVAPAPKQPCVAPINRLLSGMAAIFRLGNGAEIQRLKKAAVIGYLIHQTKYVMRLGAKVIDCMLCRARIQRVFGVNGQIGILVLYMKLSAVIVIP